MKGDSFPKIKSSLGVGVSTAHDIMVEVIEAFPDFEEVRELNLSLRKAGINVDEAKEAADLLQRLKTLNMSVNTLPEIISFYERALPAFGSVHYVFDLNPSD